MEEEVRICDYCGRVLAEEEGTPVDDELLCDDCVEEHCVTCDHCGETIWKQNSVSDEDTCLCQDCFDAHYYRCESCGQIVPESIVCWYSDLPYCERCFDEFEDEIEEYGYKPTPIFYGLKLSITLDTLTARILKLSSDSQSRIEPTPFYSWWEPTDCRADSAVTPVAHKISPDHRF